MATLKVPVTAEDHCLGNADAPITLVEYGDFQCPDCGMAYPMVKKLRKHFGKKLRFVYRNFPLIKIHALAEPAAEAAEFAASQGKFWEMHDAIFEHQRRLSPTSLVNLAEELGLADNETAAAMEKHLFSERITNDVDGGRQAGVHATPTFFINGTEYEGSREYTELASAIEEA